MQTCIKDIPELAGRTVDQIRSKLQHEFAQRIRRLDEEELRSSESSALTSDGSLQLSNS